MTSPQLRIGYVCEAGPEIGWGHAARGSALLECAAPGSALVIGRGAESAARALGRDVRVVPWDADDAPTKSWLAPFDIVAVDHYSIDEQWIADLLCEKPVLLVDDATRQTVQATLLLDQNLDASRESYPTADVGAWMLGPAYAMLRREIVSLGRTHADRHEVGEILVTLGGADPGGHTVSIANMLAGTSWFRAGGRITVVLGASAPDDVDWSTWRAEHGSRAVIKRSPPDFAALCANADLVVTAAGTTTLELAYLGRPFVPLAIADNQARGTEAWGSRGIGAALAVWRADWLDALRESTERLIADANARRAVAGAAAAIVDGRGADRVSRACADACGVVRH